MKGTGAYIYGRPCWREYGGRTTRSICVGKGVVGGDVVSDARNEARNRIAVRTQQRAARVENPPTRAQRSMEGARQRLNSAADVRRARTFFNIGKKPGTRGGALSENHPARKAGLEEDIIMGRPLGEMNDEDAIMDPSGRAVYHRDDLLRHIEAQHEQRQIANMEERALPPLTWPTRIPMTEQHVRDIANRRPTRQSRRGPIPLQDLTEEELEDLSQLYEWMDEAGVGG